MKGPGKLIGGMLLGLVVAYLLDPDRGARRRALVRDKATSAGRRLAENLDATTRDLRNRAAGTAAELRRRIHEEEADDAVLHEPERGGSQVVNELGVDPTPGSVRSLKGQRS